MPLVSFVINFEFLIFSRSPLYLQMFYQITGPKDQQSQFIIQNQIKWFKVPLTINNLKYLYSKNISMGFCKKDVTPLRSHGSFVFLALTHQYNINIMIQLLNFYVKTFVCSSIFSPYVLGMVLIYPSRPQSTGVVPMYHSIKAAFMVPTALCPEFQSWFMWQ